MQKENNLILIKGFKKDRKKRLSKAQKLKEEKMSKDDIELEGMCLDDIYCLLGLFSSSVSVKHLVIEFSFVNIDGELFEHRSVIVNEAHNVFHTIGRLEYIKDWLISQKSKREGQE